MFLGKKLRLWQFFSSISVHKRGQRALPIKSLIDRSHSSSSRSPGQRGDTGSNILASIELGSCNSVCLTQYNYFDIPVVHQFDDNKYINLMTTNIYFEDICTWWSETLYPQHLGRWYHSWRLSQPPSHHQHLPLSMCLHRDHLKWIVGIIWNISPCYNLK